MTRDSDTTFKVKGQGHQAALLTAAFMYQTAASVAVGRERIHRGNSCYVAVRSGRRGGTEGGEGRGILWRLPHSLFK